MGLLSEKTKALHAELDERAEAAISSYSAEVDFAYNICIRCLWLRIIRRSMNFPSQIFFNDINHGYRAAILKKSSLWLFPFYMAVSTYCYYKKVRRTISTATVSYLLKEYMLGNFTGIINYYYYYYFC